MPHASLAVLKELKELELTTKDLNEAQTIQNFLTILNKNRVDASDIKFEMVVLQGVAYIIGFVGAYAYKDNAPEGAHLLPHLLIVKFPGPEVNKFLARYASVIANGVLNGFFFVKALKERMLLWSFMRWVVYNSEERRAFKALTKRHGVIKLPSLEVINLFFSVASAVPYASLEEKTVLRGAVGTSYTALHINGMDTIFWWVPKLMKKMIKCFMCYSPSVNPVNQTEMESAKQELKVIESELKRVEQDIDLLRNAMIRTMRRGAGRVVSAVNKPELDEQTRRIVMLLSERDKQGKSLESINELLMLARFRFAKEWIALFGNRLGATDTDICKWQGKTEAILQNNLSKGTAVLTCLEIQRQIQECDPKEDLATFDNYLNAVVFEELTQDKLKGVDGYLGNFTDVDNYESELLNRLKGLVNTMGQYLVIKEKRESDEAVDREYIAKDPRVEFAKLVLEKTLSFLKIDNSKIKALIGSVHNVNDESDIRTLCDRADSLVNQQLGHMDGFKQISDLIRLIYRPMLTTIDIGKIKKDLKTYVGNILKEEDCSRLIKLADHLNVTVSVSKEGSKETQKLITMQLLHDVCDKASMPTDETEAVCQSVEKTQETATGYRQFGEQPNLKSRLDELCYNIRRINTRYGISEEETNALVNRIMFTVNPQSVGDWVGEPENISDLIKWIQDFYLKTEINAEKNHSDINGLKYSLMFVCVTGLYWATTGYVAASIKMMRDINWFGKIGDIIAGGVGYGAFAGLLLFAGLDTGKKKARGIQDFSTAFCRSDAKFDFIKTRIKNALSKKRNWISLVRYMLAYYSSPTVLLLDQELVEWFFSKVSPSTLSSTVEIWANVYNVPATIFTMLFNAYPQSIILDAVEDLYRTQWLGKFRGDPVVLAEMMLKSFVNESVGFLEKSEVLMSNKMSDEAFLRMLYEHLKLYSHVGSGMEDGIYRDDAEKIFEICFGESFKSLVMGAKNKWGYSSNKSTSEETRLFIDEEAAKMGVRVPEGCHDFVGWIEHLHTTWEELGDQKTQLELSIKNKKSSLDDKGSYSSLLDRVGLYRRNGRGYGSTTMGAVTPSAGKEEDPMEYNDTRLKMV